MVFNDEISVKTKMKSNKFREQVNSVTSWFGSWSTCEQTVALYSLLKQIPPLNCRFLVQMLQQRISEDKVVLAQEDEANDPVYICKLSLEPKERAIQELLSHLPLLHSGNAKAKMEYLNLIPTILSHSIEHGVFIEESRQLLSYSLIHPAITSEERSKFNMWLGHLDQRFNTSNYHSSSQQGQSEEGQGQPFSHQVVDNSVRQSVNVSNTINTAKQNAIGTGRVNGWNVNSLHQSSESLNMNSNGLENHSGSQGNLLSNGYQFQQQQQPPQQLPLHGTGMQHMNLQATHSAPPNFQLQQGTLPMQQNASQGLSRHTAHQPQGPAQHAPLRRMQSVAPPQSLPLDSHVSDWLNSNDTHLVHGPGRPVSVQSEHAPLSPQSSTASSGSGSDVHTDDPQPPVRNTFMEEESGMRDVPLWLKSLRLHKYAYLFQQMTYDEMFEITEEWLEQQNITKGARNKIILCIKKLQERHDCLKTLEKEITEGGSLKNCIDEMKLMLNTPIKAFCKPGSETKGSPGSPGGGNDMENTIQDGDLPSQFTRLMTKVYSQLMLASSYDDEGLTMYLQLIDKCINHVAFTQKQKKLLDSFKQQARKIWQPAPYKYGFDKKPRSYWGNTFPVGGMYNSRPTQGRSGVKTPPKLTTQSGTQWSFGAKRSFVGGVSNTVGGGNYGVTHLPLQRNSSHNTAIFSRPSFIEQQPVKQQVTRTQSAPLGSHAMMFGNLAGNDQSATDTEINARLDSLCRSVTECALGSSDTTERGSGF